MLILKAVSVSFLMIITVINRYAVYVPSITCDGEEIPINEKLIINSDEEFKCGDSVSVLVKSKNCVIKAVN